ncbi:hypothetical protein [Nocardioides dongkuii]|uniref:hypothetical protein n=1 Tax=Nocardioides dongkuii TaxID=2760089 RepID=UPI0015FE2AF3|nr:hypothetical protein [Nocardioides dongkuii]
MTDDLEQLVRESLHARAERVDTTAPLVGRARRSVRRRRGARAGLAAAAAVAAVVGVLSVVDGTDAVAPEPGPSPTEAVDPAEPARDTWRTEYWHDVAVDVPTDWTWGPAPMRTAGGGLYVCGGRPSRPYVGRPVFMSDACFGGDSLGDPAAPYVWLGAPLEPGTVDVGDGYTQETVEAAGTTVTVATRDAGMRERILATVRADAAPCGPAQGQDDDTVCAFELDPRGRPNDLRYAAPLPADAGAAFEGAFDRARPFPIDRRCDVGRPTELVLVAVADRRYEVTMSSSGCSLVARGEVDLRRLTPELARPWVVGGLGTTLFGPTGGLGGTLADFVGERR